VAEPVPHDGDDAGPPGGLDDAAGHLRGREEGERVDVEEVGGAERGARGAGREHGRAEEAAEVGAVGEVARGEHGERVGGEEGDVELAEAVRAPGTREGGPVRGEHGLDDARRLAGGVERRVGREGERQHRVLVPPEAPRGRGPRDFHRSGGCY